MPTSPSSSPATSSRRSRVCRRALLLGSGAWKPGSGTGSACHECRQVSTMVAGKARSRRWSATAIATVMYQRERSEAKRAAHIRVRDDERGEQRSEAAARELGAADQQRGATRRVGGDHHRHEERQREHPQETEHAGSDQIEERTRECRVREQARDIDQRAAQQHREPSQASGKHRGSRAAEHLTSQRQRNRDTCNRRRVPGLSRQRLRIDPHADDERHPQKRRSQRDEATRVRHVARVAVGDQRREAIRQRQGGDCADDAQHRKRDESAVRTCARDDPGGDCRGEHELRERLNGEVDARPALRRRRARDHRDRDPDQHPARHAGQRANERYGFTARPQRRDVESRQHQRADYANRAQALSFPPCTGVGARGAHQQQFCCRRMSQLGSSDASLLGERAQQQRLQAGNHDAADADQEDDAQLKCRGPCADPFGGCVQDCSLKTLLSNCIGRRRPPCAAGRPRTGRSPAPRSG